MPFNKSIHLSRLTLPNVCLIEWRFNKTSHLIQKHPLDEISPFLDVQKKKEKRKREREREERERERADSTILVQARILTILRGYCLVCSFSILLLASNIMPAASCLGDSFAFWLVSQVDQLFLLLLCLKLRLLFRYNNTVKTAVQLSLGYFNNETNKPYL